MKRADKRREEWTNGARMEGGVKENVKKKLVRSSLTVEMSW